MADPEVAGFRSLPFLLKRFAFRFRVSHRAPTMI